MTDPGREFADSFRRLSCPRGPHTGSGATCPECGRPTAPECTCGEPKGLHYEDCPLYPDWMKS